MPASPLKAKAAASLRTSPATASSRVPPATAGSRASPTTANPRSVPSTAPKLAPAAPAALPRGMGRFAITLKDEPAQPGTTRGRFVRGRLARNDQFRKQLLGWLEDQGLAAQVVEVGAPTAFNVLSIVTTSSVAQRVKALDGVESVFRDLPVRLK